jgi:hypothetical protein
MQYRCIRRGREVIESCSQAQEGTGGEQDNSQGSGIVYYKEASGGRC